MTVAAGGPHGGHEHVEDPSVNLNQWTCHTSKCFPVGCTPTSNAPVWC